MNPNKEWRPGQPAEEEFLDAPGYGKPDRERDATHDDPHLKHAKKPFERGEHLEDTGEKTTRQR